LIAGNLTAPTGYRNSQLRTDRRKLILRNLDDAGFGDDMREGNFMSNALATMGGMPIGDRLAEPETERRGGVSALKPTVMPPSTRAAGAASRSPLHLDRDQKAAIIIRLLADDTSSLPISSLEPGTMARLVQAMAGLRVVDEATILAVIAEFLHDIDSRKIYFKSGISGAIETLEPFLTPDARNLLSATPDPEMPIDPWTAVKALEPAILRGILQQETPQICAIALAKLPFMLAAEILSEFDSDYGAAVTLAAARTGFIDAATVQAIGAAIDQAACSFERKGALPGTAIDRVGAILNFAPGAEREQMLKNLEIDDASLADQVRLVMFTFGDIPDRVEVKDVPKLARAVPNEILVTALAGAMITQQDAAEFILANLSKRLADQLKEEIHETGDVKPKDADAAMNTVIQGIRDLESAGEVILILPES